MQSSILRNVYSAFFPAGTKRRRWLKSLLNSDAQNPSQLVEFLRSRAEVEVCKKISKVETERLLDLKDRFKGERCFIIGNGPSLNKVDLTALKNEYTFGVNGIFYKTDEVGFVPNFYVVEDGHVIDDNLDRINDFPAEFKFFPSIYKDRVKEKSNTYFFCADLGFYRKRHESYLVPRFSKRFDEVAFTGQSVTYINLQLAYYLGFETVYLLGMDFNYDIPESAIVSGITIESTEDDPNHFHPEYFGKGKKWHDPKLDMVAINYELAQRTFQQKGRKIINATHGGKLEIFERVNFDSLSFKK